MADKKISQFEDFYGSGDSHTYFVVASGVSSDVNARNYKWDFKRLSVDLKDEMFGGLYPFSGNDEALHVGIFDPTDARDLKFDIGGDTKMYIASGEGMYIKDNLRVSGDTYLLENTYVDEIFGNSGTFTLLTSDHSIAKNLKSVTGCFSDSIIVGGSHFNDYKSSCNHYNYRQYINAALNGSHSGLYIDARTRDGGEQNVPLIRLDAGLASANETFFWANSAGNIHMGSGAAPTGKLNISYEDGIQFLIDDFQSGQFIVKDGLVGIHTEEPSTQLHVYAGDNAPIFIQKPSSIEEDMVGVSFNFGNSSNSEANKPYAFIGGAIETNTNNAEDGALVFHTTLNNSSAGIDGATERARITSLGKLGLNDNNPSSWIDSTVNDGGIDGGNGLRIKNSSTQLKVEIGDFNDSYIGTTTSSYFHISTTDSPRISIDSTGNVSVGDIVAGTTPIGASKFKVIGGFSFMQDLLCIDGVSNTPSLYLRGTNSGASAAAIASDLNTIAIGTTTDNGATLPNPLAVDNLGNIAFGQTNTNISPGNIISSIGRVDGKDITLRNREGSSWQQFTLVDGPFNTNAGFSFETSGDSGSNWSEVFKVTTTDLLWNGSQVALLSDIKDGTLTVNNQSGTSLGTFTANQNGDSVITVPDTPNDGTLSIATNSGTVLGSFTANQSTNTTITVPDPPAPNNGTLKFIDGLGAQVGTFTADQASDTEITLAASVAVATAAAVGTVKPGNGLSVAADGTLSITNWNAGTEPSLFTSDKRLKSNLKFLTNAIDKVSKISGYEFVWTEDAPLDLAGKKDIGVIAQDVQSVFPDAVGNDSEGNLAVSYHKLIPVLIEALKDQQREINSLKRQVETIKNRS